MNAHAQQNRPIQSRPTRRYLAVMLNVVFPLDDPSRPIWEVPPWKAKRTATRPWLDLGAGKMGDKYGCETIGDPGP